MIYRVELTDRAKHDIRRNAEWWAQHHSATQAVEWFDTIHAQLQTLSDSPQSHAVSVENDDFPYEIRDKFVGSGRKPSYRAVFTVHDSVVYVLAIKRFAEDNLQPDDIEFHPPQ